MSNEVTLPINEAACEPPELTTGRAEFLGLELHVTRGVLVPRRETELLARSAIARLAKQNAPRVIDVGCGSGNLAVSIARFVPDAHVWAADLTEPCVATTRRNVEMLGLQSRVEVRAGDLYGAFDGLGLEGSVDVIVCNPPYISTRRLENEKRDLLRFEPREAFDAGPYGLTLHRRAIAEGAAFLRTGGWMMCEFGSGQSLQIVGLFDRTRRYGVVQLVCDDHGDPRVAIAERVDCGPTR